MKSGEQNLSTLQEIKEEHVRMPERSIGAALRSVRILEVPAVATRRILSIKNGDPFVDVPVAPWLPTKSQILPMGSCSESLKRLCRIGCISRACRWSWGSR